MTAADVIRWTCGLMQMMKPLFSRENNFVDVQDLLIWCDGACVRTACIEVRRGGQQRMIDLHLAIRAVLGLAWRCSAVPRAAAGHDRSEKTSDDLQCSRAAPPQRLH